MCREQLYCGRSETASGGANHDYYDQIHQTLANVLGELAASTGADAPLTIITHSLGTVISSNFIWDTQENR